MSRFRLPRRAADDLTPDERWLAAELEDQRRTECPETGPERHANKIERGSA